MNLFSKFFVTKQEGSDVLYYLSDGVKSDTKLHNPILKSGLSDAALDMSLSRLRARTGLSLEQAKQLLQID